MSCLNVLFYANLSTDGVKLVILGSDCLSQFLESIEQVVVLPQLDVKSGYQFPSLLIPLRDSAVVDLTLKNPLLAFKCRNVLGNNLREEFRQVGVLQYELLQPNASVSQRLFGVSHFYSALGKVASLAVHFIRYYRGSEKSRV